MDPLAGVPAAGKSSSSRIWSTRHVDTPTLELSMVSDSTRSDGLPLLTVTATWPRPNVCLVRPVGELDIATAPELASTLRAQTSSSPVHLILDLSEVSLLAATGVSVIVNALRNDDGIYGRLHLVGATKNPPVARVLDITGMTAILDLHDDLDELLSQLDH